VSVGPADLEGFVFDTHQVRVLLVDGDPWFVLADLCAVLNIGNPSMVADRLDAMNLSQTEVENARGQMRQTVIVSESGMYEVVIRSDKPEAVRFRRWITGEVLPAIRRTGRYGDPRPALTEDEIVHRALSITARRVQELAAEVEELRPRALVADRILNASGDMSVRDTAQALTRAGIKVGQNRLFKHLEGRNWIGRGGDRRYRVMQWAIERGWMSVLPQSHLDANTGGLVLDVPQPRVTMDGFRRLLVELVPDTLPISFD